ncbi:MAG: hypothetical protein JXA60_01075 [Candidatus Coatesbacteria bacterium]|nr:hypothetical protein [Candidatus Coatesbacteria bacterium]
MKKVAVLWKVLALCILIAILLGCKCQKYSNEEIDAWKKKYDERAAALTELRNEMGQLESSISTYNSKKSEINGLIDEIKKWQDRINKKCEQIQ